MKKKTKGMTLAGMAGALYVRGHSVESVAQELGISYRTAREAIQYITPLRDPSARLVGRTRPDRRSTK